MLEAARKVIRYTDDRQVQTFVADEMAYDATLRNLEVLGEAAKNIPEEVRQRYPEVERVRSTPSGDSSAGRWSGDGSGAGWEASAMWGRL